jgi:indole-3-glycerol phosphate synthase
MILDQIISHKREEIKRDKAITPSAELEKRLASAPKPRKFKAAISKPNKINLIAEVKKASPSKGVIREDFDPVKIAKLYESNGASALSVLTDEKFFQGSLSHLTQIREAVKLPILRKEFIIDEYQVYQSRVFGADAILLIVACLTLDELKRLYNLATDLKLDSLMEVHTVEELKTALEVGCEIIGINNRNLKTFHTDINTTFKLKELIPDDKIVVSESGIYSASDVKLLKSCGINAILVGEALMREEDIGKKVRELVIENRKQKTGNRKQEIIGDSDGK